MPDTYDVHEFMPGRYAWHTYDETGHVTAAWNDDQHVRGEGDQAVAYIGGTRADLAGFRTELAAHRHCIALGATCRTIFAGGHHDPDVAALLGIPQGETDADARAEAARLAALDES